MPTHPLFRVRYWRDYPWPMQLLMLFLLIFTLASFFTVIASVTVPALTGHSLAEALQVSKESPRSLINTALLSQALSHAGLFLFPSLLFAYLSHPAPRPYLGLRAPGRPVHWLLVPACILGAAPVFLGMDALMRQWLSLDQTGAQQASDRLTEAFLFTQTPGELLFSLFVVALLPALGEELFFRGVLYRFVAKRIPNQWFPVVASAAFFAAVHYNPSGLPAIFLAGVLFALFYYLTGSLLPGILAHFLYNGGQVLLLYFAQNRGNMLNRLESGASIPPAYVLGGLAVFGISFFLLWKTRTPLAPGWAADRDGSKEASL